MSGLVTLTCPTCGGKLQITPEIDRFACGYCGTEYVVNRGGGIVSLAPMVESLQRVERGVDRTASELAIVRIQQEIVELNKKRNSISDQTGAGAAAIGVFALIIAVLVSGSSGTAMLVFGCLSVLFFAGAYFAGQDVVKEKQTIETQIAAKRAELQKHHAIVAQ